MPDPRYPYHQQQQQQPQNRSLIEYGLFGGGPNKAESRRLKRLAIFVGVSVLAIILFFVGLAVLWGIRFAQIGSEFEAERDAAKKVKLDKVLGRYERDPYAAADRYKTKWVTFAGEVEEIEKGLEPFVVFHSDEATPGLRCHTGMNDRIDEFELGKRCKVRARIYSYDEETALLHAHNCERMD